MSTENRATPEGTRRYAERAVSSLGVSPEHFRDVDGLRASSIGLGTYLGDPDEETDILYTEAVVEAVRLGCNVVDSAINYRYQRSERSIGAAIARLIASGEVARDELIVATKGGYVPFDGDGPRTRTDMREYVVETFFETGVATPNDMAQGGQHCMTPRYLAHQLDRSLENLGLECVDIYYIHNPEGQLPEVGRPEFERRIRAAFELLESKVADGKIGRYGTATWNGYRVPAEANDYLGLERLVEIAREVGGDGHHFRVVQMPYNLAMPEAYGRPNQPVGDDVVTTLEAARRLGVSVFASASILQSRLAGGLPPEVRDAIQADTAAQAAIQFVRSTPGIASALVGMKRAAHVRENLELAKVAPLSSAEVAGLFEEADE
jgi:aryl-alcohol dehydrogenase-like predicted oxidoreductase